MSEAMRDDKYKEITKIYNVVWLVTKLKLSSRVFDSHINSF